MLFLVSRLSRRSLLRHTHQTLHTTSIMSAESLTQEITRQTAVFNDLRLNNADPVALDEAKKRLGELKKALAAASGASKDSGKKRERLLLKTAKGTRDFGPSEMFCREYVESIVKECFALYGGSCVDTPVFERKDILTGKYGEDAKLIFDLKDQGGEELALRYDHTVPLARYLAMIGSSASSNQSKLWQVGKVYRRDNPVISKGRMREFSQADFDITGTWDPMIPDAEILSLVNTILSRLDVGEFTIKINHRQILDGIFEVCGVQNDKLRSISSAVDKLDKLPWVEVRKEMTEEKGLDPQVADKIGEYVKHKGGVELLDTLSKDAALLANANAKQGIEHMTTLFALLKAYKATERLSFDLSLARGLDYYTGIIYEAVVEASAPPNFKSANPLASTSLTPLALSAEQKKIPAKPKKLTERDGEEDVDESQVGVGSIAGGGRYDNLVGMFTSAAAAEGKKSSSTPCVGVSIGLDRIFAIVWPKWVEKGLRSKATMVYVMSAGDGLLHERVELVSELRQAGIKSDYLAKNKPKLPTQFAAGEHDEVPFAIILGTDELSQGLVTVKEQQWEMVNGRKVKIALADKGTQVKRSDLIQWLLSKDSFQKWEQGK